MAEKINVQFVEQGGQELENKVARLEQKYRSLQQSLKETGQAGKESGGALENWGKGQVQTIAGMAAGYLTLRTAINFVTKAYQDWREEARKAHDEAKRTSAEMTQQLFRGGQIGVGPQIRGEIAGMVRGGKVSATTAQLQQVYAGGMLGAPELMQDPRFREQFFRNVGAAAPVESDLAGFAQQVGEISTGTGWGPQAAGSALLAARRMLGPERAAALTSRPMMAGMRTAIESGALSRDEAMGLAAGALRARIAPQAVEGLFNQLGNVEPVQRPTTPEDFFRNRLARMGPREQLQALLAATPAQQRALLGARLPAGLARLEDVGPLTAEFGSAVRGPGGSEWLRMQESPEYQKARVGAELSRREDIQTQIEARAAAARQDEIRRSELEMRETGRWWWEKAILRTGREIAFTAEDLTPDMGSMGGTEAAATMVWQSTPFGLVSQLRSLNTKLSTQQATSAAQSAKAAAGER